MTFFDKVKEIKKQADVKVDEINQRREEKKLAFEEKNKDNPNSLFSKTSQVGQLQIDSNHKIFKLINVNKEAMKKKESKLGNATLFMATGGLSSIAKGIGKIGNNTTTAHFFNDLIEFELVEDDYQVTSGGLGRALVGAVTFGGVGAIVGGVTGKKTTKKVVDNLFIRITVNDLDTPSLIVRLIDKKTKTKSNEYKQAYNTAHKMISMLSVIANGKDDIIQKVEIINNSDKISDTFDAYEEIKKMKELLDMGIISQEEFDAKKKELLDLE